jgi:hypothetical protein
VTVRSSCRDSSIRRRKAVGSSWCTQLAKATWNTVTPTSNDKTPQVLGWEPVHPGWIEDVQTGHYFG